MKETNPKNDLTRESTRIIREYGFSEVDIDRILSFAFDSIRLAYTGGGFVDNEVTIKGRRGKTVFVLKWDFNRGVVEGYRLSENQDCQPITPFSQILLDEKPGEDIMRETFKDY